MNNVKYILSNIRGHWAEFRPEDPQAPGYPLADKSGPGSILETGKDSPLSLLTTLKVGFSGEWSRCNYETGNACERDFSTDRHGKTALWLTNEGRTNGGTELVYIRAGCELTEFVRLVKLAGGDIWLNGLVFQILAHRMGGQCLLSQASGSWLVTTNLLMNGSDCPMSLSGSIL